MNKPNVSLYQTFVEKCTENQALLKDVLNCAIVFLFALSIRLLHLKYWQLTNFSLPIIDELDFHLLGLRYVNTHSISDTVFSKGPLYPLFIGMLYELFGVAPKLISFIQIFIGSFSCVLIYPISRRMFSSRYSLLSAFLMVLWIPAIFFDAQILRPTIITFLLLVLYHFILLLLDNKRTYVAMISGVLAGLLVCLKASNLVIVLCVILYLYYNRTLIHTKLIITFILGLTVIVIPVTGRNLFVAQDIVLISANGGINFFTGNNSNADGHSAIKPGWDWQEAKRKEASFNKDLPSQKSINWYKEAFKYIRKQPFGWLKLSAKKVLLFLGPQELANNRNLYFSSRFSKILKIPFLGFNVIFALAIIGLFFIKKRHHELTLCWFFIAGIALVNILFFTCSRYRIIAIPFTLVLALQTIIDIVKAWAIKDFKRFRQMTSFLIVVIVVLNSSVFLTNSRNYARDFFSLGSVNFRIGNMKSAYNCFTQSSVLSPNDPDPIFMAGACLEKVAKFDLAKRFYAKAIKLAPYYIEPIQNLASILIRNGEYQKAKLLLERCLQLDNSNIFTHFNMGIISENLHEFKDAEMHYKLAVDIGGARPQLVNNLAMLWLNLEKHEEKAIGILRSLVDANPETSYINDSMGWGLWLVGNKPEAERYLKKAVLLNPDSKLFKKHLETVLKSNKLD